MHCVPGINQPTDLCDVQVREFIICPDRSVCVMTCQKFSEIRSGRVRCAEKKNRKTKGKKQHNNQPMFFSYLCFALSIKNKSNIQPRRSLLVKR